MTGETEKGVLVVGSYAQDLVWNSEQFPQPGETLVGDFSTGPGGKGSNQAVSAARQGANVTFCGSVGDDLFGKNAREYQTKVGIKSELHVDPNTPTGTAAILVNNAGQNAIVVALGANNTLRPSHVTDEMLASATLVIAQHEINLDVNRDVFTRAKAAGVTTLLNPAPMAPIDDATLDAVDIFCPNETEFATLLEQQGIPFNVDIERGVTPTVIDAISKACDAIPPSIVIVTLGRQGVAVCRKGDEPVHIPGLSVECVDSTGAGDAFIGGFGARYVETGDLLEAVRHGNVTAALSVTRKGTAPSMPARAEVDALKAITYA